MGMWDDDEEIAPARSGFVKIDDFFVDDRDNLRPGSVGRLLLIKPYDKGTRESTIKGQTGDYTFIVCDVAVLDGPPSEMLPEIPTVLEGFQFAGTSLVGLLEPKLRSGKSVLGRMGAHKAQGYNTLGWHLDEPTERDFELARAFRAAMKARIEKAERAADPFAAPGNGGQQQAGSPAAAGAAGAGAPPWAR